MVHISELPPEADERRVPGHWEGDLLIGQHNQTGSARSWRRSSGFAMLVPLPDGYKPEHVAPALARKVQTLPAALRRCGVAALRRSRTWDQCPEMRDWKQIHVDAGIDVFFCDPHAPGNAAPTRTLTACCANTSPKASTSPPLTERAIDAVAHELNDRPRRPFDFATPTEQLSELLLHRSPESAVRPADACTGVRRCYLVCEGSGLGGGGPEARAGRER